MNGRGRYLSAVIPAVVVAVVAMFLVLPSTSPSPTPTPTAAWDKCIATDPRACSTFDGIALGRFEGPASLATPPCYLCHDLLGTARAALEWRALGHPPVTAIDLFGPDQHVLCGAGGPCICTCALGIYVFTFADATTFPIVVACVGITPCFAADHYPPYI